MFATQTGKTRTVDEGMWCSKCGTVVQCHVEGRDADLITDAMRRCYPMLNDPEVKVVCVLAGRGPSLYVQLPDGWKMSIGTGWKELRDAWREADA